MSMKTPTMKNASHQNGNVTQCPVSVRFASIAMLALTLAGCASLSPEQCRNANWRQIGFTDGANGASAARIDEHAKACAEHGIRPNLDEYLSGRSQGLLNYCQAENGFSLGRRASEHNVADCPENLKPAFLEQYHRGSQIHSLEEEIRSYRYRIDSNRTEIRHDDERIAAIKTELLKRDLPTDRRAALLSEYERLVEKKDALNRNRLFLQREIDRLEIRVRVQLREFGHY